MSLDVGTLVAKLKLDDSPLDRGLKTAGTKFRTLGKGLKAETDRMEQDSGRAGRSIGKNLADGAAKEGEGGGRRFGAGFFQGLNKKLGGEKADVSKIGGRLLDSLKSTVGAGQPLAVTLGTAFSAQFIGSAAAGLAQGGLKLAHGLAAGVALLPSALIAAGVGLATFKIALAGVGDALEAGLTGDTEAFNEALKKMAPEARTFARGIVSLKDEAKDLKREVQGNFFEGWSKSVRPLGERWLPILQSELGGVATHFGGVARQFTVWAQQPRVVVGIAGALGNMRVAIGNVTGGVRGLVRAFLPLVTVGSTFLPGLTNGFGGATDKLARFMEHAERTGRLREWISQGLSKIGDLVDRGRQLGRVFGNIADIGRVVFKGLGFESIGLLDKLEQLSQKAKAFFDTAEGGEVAATIFETLRAVVSSLTGTVSALAVGFGRDFGPLLPLVTDFLEQFATLKLTVIAALIPIAAIVTGAILPPLTKLLRFINSNRLALAAVTAVVVALFAAWAAGQAIAFAKTVYSLVTLNGQLGNVIGSFQKLGGVGKAALGAGIVGSLVGVAFAISQVEQARKSAKLDQLAKDFINTGESASIANAATDATWSSYRQLRGEFERVMAQSPQLAQQWLDQAEAAGVYSGTLAVFQGELDDANRGQRRMADAADDAKSAVEKEEEAVSQFNTELDRMLGKTLAVPEAQAAFTQALAQATDGLERHKEEFGAASSSMDANTAAGAANIEMIAGLVRAGADVITSMRDQGASGAELRAEQARQVDAIRAVADQFGLEKGAVDLLLGSLFAIPASRSTEIVVRKGAALAAIAAVQGALATLHDKTVTVRVSATGAGAGVLGGITVPKSHTGERIPGGANTEVLRVLQGGEEVLSRGDRRNARNIEAARASSASSAGGVMQALKVLVQLDGAGLLENLRWHVQTIGGGDVQRALGTT